jgi:hypothetical protein
LLAQTAVKPPCPQLQELVQQVWQVADLEGGTRSNRAARNKPLSSGNRSVENLVILAVTLVKSGWPNTICGVTGDSGGKSHPAARWGLLDAVF